MRSFLIVLGVACSGAPPAPATPPPTTWLAKPPRVLTSGAVDVIEVLAKPATETASILMGPAQIIAGGTTLEPREPGTTREVDLIEERGSEVRVGIRHNGVRFAVWIARAHLFGVLGREQRVSAGAGVPAPPRDVFVALQPNARVHMLARRDGWTQIRYIGTLEVEGWIPDDALVARGPAGRRATRIYPGGRLLLHMRGAIIRSEAKATSAPLAILHHSTTLSVLDDLPDDWREVSYRDSDVMVRGFVSRRAPSGRIHGSAGAQSMPSIETNAMVPANTCLYINEEPVGLVDMEMHVSLVPARAGWFTLTVDTPWGPVAFEAKGSVETQLATCP